ncbi:DUF3606 domain-containing protein [Muricoccus radiodurans]|uniref:DUF3606 domain-containing protein n=1 Tax=Muricoccus radiodurans TaxID=2231721 RepID=UPI003CF1672D
MADDPKDRGPRDRERINLHEDHEVRYWTRKFGVSEPVLTAAVEAVGVMAKDVAARLKKPWP